MAWLVIGAFACNRGSVVLQQRVTLTNNLVILPVSINGSQPLSFILDTGASATVIDRTRAGNLGLAAKARPGVSTGGGDIEASDIKDVTLRIGDLTVADLNVIAIDLAGLSSGLGHSVAGILGYDLFHRYVVAIDYPAQLVTLHDPARYITPSAGDVIPITIEEQTPFVEVTMAGNPAAPAAKVEFDTGKTGALTLLREYVDKYSLLRPGQREVAVTAGALLPGKVSASLTRVQAVRVGRVNLNDVVTMVVPDREDAGVSGTTVGLLGGDLLKRFAIAIDYSRNHVILVPSDRALGEPFQLDMTGISLAAEGSAYRDYVVRTVIPGSPAAEIGVAAGDRLTAIDGKPAGALTLEQIRELFRKDGQIYAITLQRGDATIAVDLRTRPLL